MKLLKFGLLLGLGALSVSQATATLVFNVDLGSINNGPTIDLATPAPYGTDFGAFERLNVGTTFGPAGQKWTVGGNNVDYITGYWQSPDGSYTTSGARPDSVDLEGSGPGGSISTTLDVGTGGPVTINFSISGNPDAGAGLKSGTISVLLGGLVQDLSYSVVAGANTDANMGWIAESVTFNDTGTGLQTLTFSDTDPNTGFGLVIGNAAVPEPTTIVAGALMLLPLGVSALRIMRKSRIA